MWKANSAYFFPPSRPTRSDNFRLGAAQSSGGQLQGLPIRGEIHENLGTPDVAATNNILTTLALTAGVAVAPNASTTSGSLAGGVSQLDVPRGVQIASAGADTTTILITGTDCYGAAMSELITLNGTTPVLGKKAFYTISAITATATPANNIIVGTTKVLGLSYKMALGFLPVGSKNVSGTVTADAGTVVQADATTPATTTTGDVRGTYSPAGTLNQATTQFFVRYVAASGPTDVDGFGVTQA